MPMLVLSLTYGRVRGGMAMWVELCDVESDVEGRICMLPGETELLDAPGAVLSSKYSFLQLMEERCEVSIEDMHTIEDIHAHLGALNGSANT